MDRDIQLKYLRKREKLKYMVIDFECENYAYKGRGVSQFYDKNYIVMAGWKVQGDKRCHSWYVPTKQKKPLFIPDDVNMIVGHNLKFDLLWIWDTEEMRDFIKRGGRVWDTQTAEYLIRGMTQEYHMNSMDSIIESYGGRLKIDEVKHYWEDGFKTSQIDPDLLKDYLIGTEEEGFNSGDIGNTELIFKGQWNKALEQCQIPMIEERMNSLLALTEMEFNGLYVNIKLGDKLLQENLDELKKTKQELEDYLGVLPDGCVFNWGSSVDVSCLLFGGTKAYRVKDYIRDDEDNIIYTKKEVTEPRRDKNGEIMYFKSGKQQGEMKTRKVKVDDYDKPKMKYVIKGHRFPRLVTPLEKWKSDSERTTQFGEPIYSTGADVMRHLKNTADIPFVKAYIKFVGMSKDISAFFKVVTQVQADEPNEDGVREFINKPSGEITLEVPKGYSITKQGGMLTLVDEHGIIHHGLNPSSTSTGRLSSSNPNSQQLPNSNKSNIRQLFTSRWEGGKVAEVDYSQLEVVVLGALSQDKQLIEDLHNKVDFHCKRVAIKYASEYKGGYDEVVAIKNDETHPLHDITIERRQACKIFSFQKQYGAGAKTIAETTGMSQHDVEELMRLEDETYNGVVQFNNKVEQQVKKFARRVYVPKWKKQFMRGSWQAPTGTIFTWNAIPTDKQYLKAQGISHEFSQPALKNYPIQGIGGEMVQSSVGRLFRDLVKHGFWSGGHREGALLTNTVHDCAWFDFKDELIAKEVLPIAKYHMENIPGVYKELYDIELNVPFPVEAEIGDSMFKLHHVEVGTYAA